MSKLSRKGKLQRTVTDYFASKNENGKPSTRIQFASPAQRMKPVAAVQPQTVSNLAPTNYIELDDDDEDFWNFDLESVVKDAEASNPPPTKMETTFACERKAEGEGEKKEMEGEVKKEEEEEEEEDNVCVLGAKQKKRRSLMIQSSDEDDEDLIEEFSPNKTPNMELRLQKKRKKQKFAQNDRYKN